MDVNEFSERLERLEAAAALRRPDDWPAARVFPDMLAWSEPEPLPWTVDDEAPIEPPADPTPA